MTKDEIIRKIYDVQNIVVILADEVKILRDIVEVNIGNNKNYQLSIIHPESESLVKARESYKLSLHWAEQNTKNNLTPWLYVEQIAIKSAEYIRELEAHVKQLENRE